MLIWAGSPLFDNRNIFDFKAVHSMGKEPHLSLIWQHALDGSDDGYGVILNNNYAIQKKIPYPKGMGLGAFDIHEFNILDDGQTGLAITYRSHVAPLEDMGRPGETTSVLSGGYTVLDLNAGKLMHDWDSFDKIALHETIHFTSASPAEPPPGWDYVHANSVDRNSDGDYIMSMRFTNTIYMISGADGHIMWRLGGRESNFEQDFTFSKQHDAKFIESNSTYHVISLMNNASDEESNEEDVSSALIVELDTAATPMTARVLRRYNRPDGKLTRLRGNTQVLSNNNVFIGWSEGGYFTEHAEDGELLLSARFASPRLSSYRVYKFEFTGRPSTPPDVVASVWGTDETDLTTTFYVTWNGATDVAWWNFYARASEKGRPVFVGNTSKRDFETMYITKGYLNWVSVEAVDNDGNVLGTSLVHRTKVPQDWEAAGFNGYLGGLRPSDPSSILNSSEGDNSSNDQKAGGPLQHFGDSQVQTQTKELSRIVHDTYTLVRDLWQLFIFVILVCVAGGLCVGVYYYLARRHRQARTSYEHVLPQEEDLPLRAVPPE